MPYVHVALILAPEGRCSICAYLSMRGLLSTFLDALFPPNEEALTVRALEEDTVSLLFAPRLVSGVSALARFSDKRIRALIHEAKFHQNERAFALLAHLVERYLDEHPRTFDCIVPIPLSPKRLRERGYNQVTEVLRAKPLPVPVLPGALTRSRHTSPQTALGRKERLTNVVGAFTVRESQLIAGKRVLLIDDVTTTGATLAEARRALRMAHPASVTCIALAH